jgi:hypothetical protein
VPEFDVMVFLLVITVNVPFGPLAVTAQLISRPIMLGVSGTKIIPPIARSIGKPSINHWNEKLIDA